MYRKLKQHQCPSPIRVYRGQIISNDELDTLRRSTGEFISINSFFSSSVKRHKALEFVNSCDISKDLHRVLFVIDADPHIVTSKLFADISSLSDIGNECEVLFMIGCIFRLIDIRQDNDKQIWMIRMELCGDDEHALKKLFDHMKEEYGGSGGKEVNLRSFGRILRQMGKYDAAEKIYHRLLKELSADDPSLSGFYWSLALVNKDKSEYDFSLVWFHKSLEIHMQRGPSNYVNIGNLYNSIGESHRLKGDHNTALEYYNKAAELFQKTHDENHSSMAHFCNNIAIIHHKEKNYSRALHFYKIGLNIDEKNLPPDHPDMASSYNNTGTVHRDLGQYDLAMQHYERCLKMRLKSLPSQHPDIAMSYRNIGIVYEMRSEWKQALEYYQNAATIYSHSLPAQHPDIIQIERNIQHISSKLK